MRKDLQILGKIRKTRILSVLSKVAPLLEWANIPKSSKLDNIKTSLRLSELFFDDALVDMVAGYAKLYNHREKADTSFEITNETFRLFLGMVLPSGCHKIPDLKLYWETSPILLLN